MAMSGAITVDTTAGGVAIIQSGIATRAVLIANTGSQPCALKLDQSSTALTYANGCPLAAGEKLLVGGLNGADIQLTVKAIASGAGSTTVTAQSIPN